MADITTKRISELIAAQGIGDSDLFVIEQGGAAKKALGSVVKEAIGGSSLPDGGSNGQVLTKTSSGAAWSDAGTPTQAQADSAVADWLDAHPEATTTVQDGSITEQKLDPYLKAKVNGGGLTNEAKQALLALLGHVYFDDDHGPEYIEDLRSALYPPISISVVFNQGSAAIYNTDTLDTLRQYLTVTANYSGGVTEVVTAYGLSGSLAVGASTITATYGGKSATFNVTVTKLPNGLVDGTYNVANLNEIVVRENSITFTLNNGYKNIDVPLKHSINLHSGDVVWFNVVGDGGETSSKSVSFGFNGNTYASNTAPWRATPISKSYTVEGDLTATTVCVSGALLDRTLTLSITVNGEEVF